MLEDDPDKKSDQNAMYAWDLMERYIPEIFSRTEYDDRRFVHYRAKSEKLAGGKYPIEKQRLR